MKVGQYIYVLQAADIADVYLKPQLNSTVYSFTAGYVGKVSKLAVAGTGGDSNKFTEIVDAYNIKKYINNTNFNEFFEVSDTAPDATPVGTGTGGTSTDSTPWWQKALDIGKGLLGIFGAKAATITPNSTPAKSGSNSTTVIDPKTPAPDNNPSWFASNWFWVIPAIIIVPGGIIWAIVAAANAKKKKMLALGSPNNNQNVNPQPLPNRY